MQQQFLIKEDHSSLLLFFAGWGMDGHPFEEYRPQGCDFMICYDYRSLDFDFSLIRNYSSISLVAWSMGVWVASQVFASFPDLIEKSVAVNGTPFPVHEKKGIAPVVFYGTLEGLSESTLVRFFRRMCGSSACLASFLAKSPRRSWEELYEELKCIGELSTLLPVSSFRWGKSFIGIRDKIFLPSNQLCAWSGVCVIEQCDFEHYSEECFKEVLRWTNN